MTADNLIGKKLGDYILRRKLATGGMSHIYIGEDEKLGRKAAVKILTPDMQRGDTVLSDRFEREARAVAALEHDSIIPIYQFGQYEDMYFLAMRYIEGMDLADEIQHLREQGKMLEVPRALYILEQVASALDYAHRHNIIHRDVKPSNVLLGTGDKAYLSDFGLVLWHKVDKTLGTAFGTPRYISPEQATDSTAVVPQSDVYSLAVMVYEIVTGAQLYDGPHPIEVALAHVTGTPTPPRAHNPAIPVSAQNEILKALSKEPAQRHKTASEFIQALKTAYSTEAIAPTPVMTDVPMIEDSNPSILDGWDRPAARPLTAPTVKDAIRPAIQASIPSPAPVASDSSATPVFSQQKPRSYLPYGIGLVALVVVGLALAILGGGGGQDATLPAATATQETVAQVQPTQQAATEEAGSTDAPVVVTESPTEPSAPAGQVTLTLRYNPGALVLVNESEQTVIISDLIFKSVSGTDEDRFVSDGKLGTTLIPGACLLFKADNGTVPSDWNCNSSTATILNTPEMFWFANTTEDTQFTALSGENAAGQCETVGRAVRRLDAVECRIDWTALADG